MNPSLSGRGVRGRLLISGSGDAVENMAIDAAILESARPEQGPTLRLYSWKAPTLSLGYFQSIDQRSVHLESLRLPVVRRGTGGGAIVHDRELTYSLVRPAAVRVPGAAPAVYRAVHDVFAECLADYGIRAIRFAESWGIPPRQEPFLCFQRRTAEDLIVNQYKVLGSAQRRGAAAVLQHGSLLLAASPAAPQLPGLRELCGRSLPAHDIFASISQKLGALWEVQWASGELTAAERAAASGRLANRFAAEAWTQRR